MSSVTVKVRRGRAYRVSAAAIATAPPVAPRRWAAEGRIRGRGAVYGGIRVRFHHLGGRLATRPRPGGIDAAGDRVNTWQTLTYETGPIPSLPEILSVNSLLLDRATIPAEPVRYLYSDRPVYGQGMPLGANATVSGYQMTLALTRKAREGEASPPTQTYGFQAGAEWVDGRRTAAQMLALWDTLEDAYAETLESRRAWRRRREEIERIALERFDTKSQRFTPNDATLRATKTGAGFWAPSFAAGDQFYAWTPANPGLYRSVLEVFGGDRPAVPYLSNGDRVGTTMDCHLVPKRHNIMFAWTAVYAVAVLFAPIVFVTEVNIGSYNDILPLDWSLVGAEDDFINEVSMSARIQQSRRYAVAINQDLGSQSFSPYFLKILVARQDGQWVVREGRERAGDLAAVLDVHHDGGRATNRYRIYRRTNGPAGARRINYGALQTQEVSAHNRVSSIWARSIPFGAI